MPAGPAGRGEFSLISLGGSNVFGGGLGRRMTQGLIRPTDSAVLRTAVSGGAAAPSGRAWRVGERPASDRADPLFRDDLAGAAEFGWEVF